MGNKKDVIVKAAKKPSRTAGRKAPMPDRNQKMIMAAAVVVFLIIAVSLAYTQMPKTQPPADTSAVDTAAQQANADVPLGEAKRIALDTDKGKIVVEVYPQAMPKTVANFQKLVDSKFYNGLTFHRVEDWVIQGGDPKGNGTGGPGWTIPLEKSPAKLSNVRGALAMARSQDPNSAGSQFYILKKDQTALNGQYAVFGKVVEGMEVVDKIQQGDKMKTVAPYTGQ